VVCECKWFVSETVPSEDDRLWSKRLKAGLKLPYYGICCVVVVEICTLGQRYGVRREVCVCVCVCMCVCLSVCRSVCLSVCLSVCVCIIGDGLWWTCVYVMHWQRTQQHSVSDSWQSSDGDRVHTPTSRTNKRDGQGIWEEEEGDDIKRVYKRLPVEFSTVLFRWVINNIWTAL
jgi:hypothetical protein